ncbi:MAG: magnesium transporter [Elusimicrobia bacterium RIFOXYC2_FULL_34_12]|nr:MAG: magnesium transporter [Elusimicrobia bacterium RIFOXYC2_FULL_34_12]OGS38370.1 MAG: magnesium transporter [Elusimicrobia bacterium RIFOXYD2_FULL_34_30]HAM38148.1 magnesium transporter [Elusimicrobiota bacterium]
MNTISNNYSKNNINDRTKRDDIQPWALFLPEIKELICDKKFHELKKLLKGVHPIDLAEGWVNFLPKEKLIVFKLLEIRKAVEVFEELDFEEQTYILNNLEDISISEILTGMASDEKAKLFKKFPERIYKKMTTLLRKEDVDEVKNIVEYPKNTAGRLMSTDFVTLSPSLTAKHSLEKIQACARIHKIETIYVLYVVDDRNILIGGVTLRRLISAPQDIKISDIMSPVQLIKINVKTDQEDVAKKFSKYDLTAAPVVDDENHLIGIITIDDIVDVIQQEASEDIAKMGGTSASELSADSVVKVVRYRMPWLFVTFLGGLVTSWIMSGFQRTLSEIIALASFIPVVLGMGNNIGVQSAVIVVRALVIGQFEIKKVLSAIFREFKVGLLIGVVFGLFLGVVAYIKNRHGVPPEIYFAFAVGSGICASMTFAALIGMLIPVILYKFKIDPAVASGPFVATATDIVSLTSYLVISTVILL